MLRHKWFKIIVALQLLNFVCMALLEQQRRTIWNKEATNTQQLVDTKFFTEKTEDNYKTVARQLSDLQTRIAELQAAAAQTAGNAAMIKDIKERLENSGNPGSK